MKKPDTAEIRPFDQAKGVRRIARDRVGVPPATKPIEPKDLRKKPKHKKPAAVDETEY